MCATCGWGIDLGGIEDVFAKDYRCDDCSLVFKASATGKFAHDVQVDQYRDCLIATLILWVLKQVLQPVGPKAL